MPTVIFSSINSLIDNLDPLKVLPKSNPNISYRQTFLRMFFFTEIFSDIVQNIIKQKNILKKVWKLTVRLEDFE